VTYLSVSCIVDQSVGLVIQMAGPVFFFCPPMLIFILLLNQIVREKELRLRQGMNIMGLSDSMFWLSWFITAEILACISTALIVGVGWIVQLGSYFLCLAFGVFKLTFGYRLLYECLSWM
jgi:hypothetical protein